MISSFYSQENFNDDINIVEAQIKSSGKQYDEIVALARGGSIAGVVLSHRLGIPITIVDWSIRDGGRKDYIRLHGIQMLIEKGKRVLIVDDILDSGKTLIEIYDVLRSIPDLCVLVWNVRNEKVLPEFFGRTIDRQTDKRWVDFWWEVL